MTPPNQSPQNDASGRRSDTAGQGLRGGPAGGEQAPTHGFATAAAQMRLIVQDMTVMQAACHRAACLLDEYPDRELLDATSKRLHLCVALHIARACVEAMVEMTGVDDSFDEDLAEHLEEAIPALLRSMYDQPLSEDDREILDVLRHDIVNALNKG